MGNTLGHTALKVLTLKNFMTHTIPKDFKKYWRHKKGMRMTVQQCWHKWHRYWSQRQNGPAAPPDHGDSYVLARWGDQGEYTVNNCRVITHRANTLERNHLKCRTRLQGRTQNPTGGVQKNRNRQIETPLGVYENCAEAGRVLGMHRSTVWHRVSSDRYPDWRWC